MDTASPWVDVLPGPRGRLLVTLVQLRAPVTVRALARHAEVSPQGALGYVNELVAAGVVLAERAGPALMVALNRQHLAAEPLEALAHLRGRLIERLREELSAWAELGGAWLFGSTARGDGGPDSDVDLLLVTNTTLDSPAWASETARLRERVHAWTGNDAQLVEYTRSSFARLVTHQAPMVAAVRTDGIPLTRDGRELLRGTA